MKTFGICAHAFSPGWRNTFDALGQALNVSFEERSFGDDRDVAGTIVLGADRQLASNISRLTRPCYVVLDDRELLPNGTSPTLTCVNHPELPAVLRARDVTADDVADAKALPPWLDDVRPVALKDGAAVWATQERGACAHHYVALPPPELNAAEPLFAHFSGQRIARLLPLILFVTSLRDDRGWEPPPLLASFMFDDPNLHWTTYGFIDYAEMVRRARKGAYHVSVATIPLDSWFVHPATGAIFKKNPREISLLYHGNDHVSNELAQALPAEAMQRLLRRAVSRVADMEARTGLDVARVMAPPHGACSETALAEMARVGFEAVCVSRGSLRHHNHRAAWTRTIGWRPCDMVSGLPVIPRFGLSKNCQNDILIAALLHQPIVPMTHHQAVSEGYGLLDEIAAFINSLGEVTWADMKTASRSMYSRRQDNGTLSVRMFTRHVSVPVPAGTTCIRVDRPWLQDRAGEALFSRTPSRHAQWSSVFDAGTIAATPGQTIEIASWPAGAVATETHAAGRRRLTPVARRFLTEVRDRALPSIHRIAGRGGRAH